VTNVPFQEISPQSWSRLRGAYSYPAVRLVSPSIVRETSIKRGQLPFGVDIHRKNEATDDGIERYHRELLLSAEPEEQLLGAASAAFWGWYGSASVSRKPTVERALIRASFVFNGHRRESGANEAEDEVALRATKAALADARQHMLQNDLRAAFTAYRRLYDIGASFATKFIAFVNPQSAAALDKVVCKKLSSFVDRGLQEIGTDFVRCSWNQTRQASLYVRWCELCARTAENLNRNDFFWLDRSGAKREWRAIDIERAIFAWPGVKS
jgi:hypothetical protein